MRKNIDQFFSLGIFQWWIEIILLITIIILIKYLKKESGRSLTAANVNRSSSTQVRRNISRSEEILRLSILIAVVLLVLRLLYRFGAYMIDLFQSLFTLSGKIWTILIVVVISIILIGFLVKKLENYKVWRVLSIAFVIIIALGIIRNNYIKSGSGIKINIPKEITITTGKENTIAVTTTTNHTEDLGDLHWGINTIRPGNRLYFNRAATFKANLEPFDTLHFKKEGYEETVYWDLAYDTAQKRVRVINSHDDRTGWGRFYVITDKEITTDIY
jgi:hypothetical protein